jgi:hypothetical protein
MFGYRLFDGFRATQNCIAAVPLARLAHGYGTASVRLRYGPVRGTNGVQDPLLAARRLAAARPTFVRLFLARAAFANLARAAACFLVAISCSSRLGAAGRGVGRYPRGGRLGGAAPLAGDLFAGVALRFAARSAVLSPGPPDATRRRVHARALWHIDATFVWWPAIEVRRD